MSSVSTPNRIYSILLISAGIELKLKCFWMILVSANISEFLPHYSNWSVILLSQLKRTIIVPLPSHHAVIEAVWQTRLLTNFGALSYLLCTAGYGYLYMNREKTSVASSQAARALAHGNFIDIKAQPPPLQEKRKCVFSAPLAPVLTPFSRVVEGHIKFISQLNYIF